MSDASREVATCAISLSRPSAHESAKAVPARQGQGLADWQEELTQAVDLAVDHLSLYQLTIEPGTAFGDIALVPGPFLKA